MTVKLPYDGMTLTVLLNAHVLWLFCLIHFFCPIYFFSHKKDITCLDMPEIDILGKLFQKLLWFIGKGTIKLCYCHY